MMAFLMCEGQWHPSEARWELCIEFECFPTLPYTVPRSAEEAAEAAGWKILYLKDRKNSLDDCFGALCPVCQVQDALKEGG